MCWVRIVRVRMVRVRRVTWVQEHSKDCCYFKSVYLTR